MKKNSSLPSMRVFWLAMPVIISNVSIPLLGMMDIAVIARTHLEFDLAAVSIGSVFFDGLFGLMNFLRMGTTGLVAQSSQKQTLLLRSLMVALGVSVIVALLYKPLWLLCFYMANNSQAIEASLSHYYAIRYLAMPATLISFVIMGYCFGRLDTRLPLLLLVVTNVMAMTLDVILVVGCQLGTAGVAWASVIAQWFGVLLGLIGLQRKHRVFDAIPRHWWQDYSAYLTLFHLNKNIFIRTTCLMVTMGFFTYRGSVLGTQTVAANAIMMSCMMFMSYGLDGFAIACEGLVGQAIGQKNGAMFKQAIWDCAKWSMMIASIFALIWGGAGRWVIQLLSDIDTVNQIAFQTLPWLVGLSFISAVGFLFDGVYIGATWSVAMRNTMIFSTLMVFFPSIYFSQSMGNQGLWLSYALFLSARGGSLVIDFFYRQQLVNMA